MNESLFAQNTNNDSRTEQSYRHVRRSTRCGPRQRSRWLEPDV